MQIGDSNMWLGPLYIPKVSLELKKTWASLNMSKAESKVQEDIKVEKCDDFQIGGKNHRSWLEWWNSLFWLSVEVTLLWTANRLIWLK